MAATHEAGSCDPRADGRQTKAGVRRRRNELPGAQRELLLRVPYFAQTSTLNCGPTCLRMIAATYGEDPGVAVVEQAAGLVDGKVITTLELALAVPRVVQAPELSVRFCSTCPGFNESNLRHAYYQRYNAASVEASQRQLSEARAVGVHVEQRSCALAEIQDWLSRSTAAAPRLVLALLDWNVVAERAVEAYCGHFVVLVASHDGWVHFHNPDLDPSTPAPWHGPSRSIPHDVFERARLADGTDEDLVFISAGGGDGLECDKRRRLNSEDAAAACLGEVVSEPEEGLGEVVSEPEEGLGEVVSDPE